MITDVLERLNLVTLQLGYLLFLGIQKAEEIWLFRGSLMAIKSSLHLWIGLEQLEVDFGDEGFLSLQWRVALVTVSSGCRWKLGIKMSTLFLHGCSSLALLINI